MRFQLFLGAWALTCALVVGYVVIGTFTDWLQRVQERRRQRVLRELSMVLFESEDEAAAASDRATKLPRRMLLSVIQTLAVDLEGQAHVRLQQLTRSSGLQSFIMKRAKARRWRLRVQAAQLQFLVLDPDFDRRLLLADPHPLVRARAAESLDRTQAAELVEPLLALLGDEAIVVRISAQQKLLDVGSPAVPALLAHLRSTRLHLIEVLELAANLSDTRLTDVLDRHASSEDPATRLLVARALSNGGAATEGPILRRLLDDEDEGVRTAAIESLGRLQDVGAGPSIAACLTDRAWVVRRAAGVALDAMGPAGRVLLRQALHSDDAFARDMARQMLDAAGARMGAPLTFDRPGRPPRTPSAESAGDDSVPALSGGNA